MSSSNKSINNNSITNKTSSRTTPTTTTPTTPPLSDDDLKAKIRLLIPKVDLEKTGVKAFIRLLSQEYAGGADLKPRTDFIRAELSAAINEMSSGADDDDDDDDNESSDDESSNAEEVPKKKRGAGKGLSVKKEITPELAEFLGQGNEMGRTDIVKGLWDYIKEHQLQNPENKREILLDDKMKRVFGCDTFTMFTMNKYVGAHIHPFKPVDLTSKPIKKPATKKSDKDTPKKRKKAGDDSSSPQKKKRKPKKPGLQPPYRLSPTLAKVVGTDILPRPQVVTALWDYIKKNGLQNPNDKRQILCDEKLKAVMGGSESVTMFNMNRYITEHLVEKLDRSAYVHDDSLDPVADKDDAESDEEEEDSV